MTSHPKNTEIKGILYKILNLLFTAIITVANKHLVPSLGVFQLFFLYAIFGFIFISLFIKIFKRKSLWTLTKSINLRYVLRGFCNMMGRAFFLFGLTEIDATVATAILYLRPIFAMLLAIGFLSEKITWKISSAVLISILGAAFVIGPVMKQSNGVSILPIIAIFLSPLAWAFYELITKTQSQKDHWEKQIYLLYLITSVFSFPAALSEWEPLSFNMLLALAAVGFIYILLEISLAKSLQYITLVLSASVSFTRIVFTSILAYLFIGEKITLTTLTGSALIIGATFIVLVSVSKKGPGSILANI